MQVYMLPCVYVYTYTHTYFYTHMCIYIYVCMYTHTHPIGSVSLEKSDWYTLVRVSQDASPQLCVLTRKGERGRAGHHLFHQPWSVSCIHYFCSHPIGRRLVAWPHRAAREAGNVFFIWAVMCSAKNSITTEEEENEYVVTNGVHTDLERSSFLPLKTVTQQQWAHGPGRVTDILSILGETAPTFRISCLGAGEEQKG